MQLRSDPEVRRKGRRVRWEESHMGVQFPENLVRPLGSPQVKVTQQKNPTSPRKGDSLNRPALLDQAVEPLVLTECYAEAKYMKEITLK